ncbi:putative Xaa-Pro aminopeptidase P [Grifola frondosa]|uniref:Putative Xaa-Pro aminopeptidase P n=1 Tax=Grifola frondosa TaxID=5627 RepID=A0A1C7ML66_GRIFR|nr:putative Xaa-Pro aminopeptidase P [Grifola frondosa]
MLLVAFRASCRARPLASLRRAFNPRKHFLTTMGVPAAQTVDTTKRLQALRELMVNPEYNVQAVVVPSEDQHSSEYIAQCDERRAFISGFTGSAGCVVVTLKDAYLFTDGRYFLQAEKQLDQNWTLMKQGLPDVPTWQDFLSKNLDDYSRIGIDSTLITAADAETIQTPSAPNKVFPLMLPSGSYTSAQFLKPPWIIGESHIEKIGRLREELKKKNVKAMIVTCLTKSRGCSTCAVLISTSTLYFLRTLWSRKEGVFFVNSSQVDDAVIKHLGPEVAILPYDSFFSYLTRLGAELGITISKDAQVLVGDKASLAIAEALGADNIVVVRSPVADLKSIKNETEIEGFRQCHIRDGAALVREAADQLEKYRSELDLFRGLSFTTISSTGPNGAIIHYSPDPNDCAIIRKDQIYLCDSGGQYLDGTTDVTRTLHFGTPTTEEKRAFTRVLQGHIAIDTAVFPNGTSGYIIDSWARRPLWEDGLGHFLNVHEGPHGIGVRIIYNSTPLKAGMTVSNEPGYYADGRFGIRIENVVIVREATTPNNFGDKGFLRFEHVTMCPLQKNLVDVSLLTAKEKEWLNAYHAEILEKVSPLLHDDSRALAWLKRECSPL